MEDTIEDPRMPGLWEALSPLTNAGVGHIHDRIVKASTNLMGAPSGSMEVIEHAAVAALPLAIASKRRNGAEDIDLDYIAGKLSEANHEFDDQYRSVRNRLNGGILQQAGGSNTNYTAMTRSMFEGMLDTCLMSLTMEPCDQVMSDSILSCFGTMTIPCNFDGRFKVGPYLTGLKFGQCKTADSKRDMYGLGAPLYGKIGGLCWDKIGFAIKEDMNCGGIGAAVLDIAVTQTRPYWIDHLAEFGVKYLLGIGCDEKTCGNDYRPWFMGCRYNLYSLDGEGDFVVNKMCLNRDLDGCTVRALFKAVECLEEDERNCHPFTGRQVRCCPNKDVIVFGKGCNAEMITDALGAHQLTLKECSGEACAEERSFPKASRPGYGSVKRDPLLTQFAFKHFKELYGVGSGREGGEFSDKQIQQMVDRTYIFGCTQQVVKRLIPSAGDYIRRSWNGAGTWPWFDQGIQRAEGIDTAAGWMINPLERGAITLVQGLPDGLDDCAQLCDGTPAPTETP